MMKFIRHSGSTDSIVIYRQANRLTDRYKYNKTDTIIIIIIILSFI